MANIFTTEWSASDTLTAEALNQNFDDVSAILSGGIKNQHISTAANIGADKIADRYTLTKTAFNLVPFGAETGTDRVMFSDASGNAPAGVAGEEFYVPTSAAKIARHEIIAQAGMEGHLMGIAVYVTAISSSGGNFPLIKTYLNNALIGQSIALKADDTFYRLHANNPFSNPLLALSDKDVIDFVLTADGSGTSCRGVWATVYERWAIGS